MAGVALIWGGFSLTPARVGLLFAPDGEITQRGFVYALQAFVAVTGLTLVVAAWRAPIGLLHRALLLSVALGLPLGGLELTLRALEPRPVAPPPDTIPEFFVSKQPGLIWENNPGYLQEEGKGHHNGRVSYNSHGLRDEERRYSRSLESIVVVGDSIEAWDIPTQLLYPKRLEAKLNARPERPQVQVLNFGAFGYSLRQKILILKYRGLEWKPKHVIVGYCLNDPIPSSEFVAHFTGRPQPVVSLRTVRLLNDRARALMQGFGSDFHVEIHQPNSASWAGVVADLNELAALAKEHAFQATLVIFPLLYDTAVEYPWADIHRRVQATAQAVGLSVIDLLDRYRREGFANVRDDDVHPSPRGHEIAAEQLYEVITRAKPIRVGT